MNFPKDTGVEGFQVDTDSYCTQLFRDYNHGVDSSTLEVMPIDSIRFSSSVTLVRRGSGTCRGV